uniref:LRRCT domain-containing protein n=1 Tax=Syphacia muris TaxID=451379 RepID=A0A0N5AWE6_9BILA
MRENFLLLAICAIRLFCYSCADCPKDIDRNCICEESIDGLHVLCREYQNDLNSLLESLDGLRIGCLTVVKSKWPVIKVVRPVNLASLKIVSCSVQNVTDQAFLPIADSLIDLVLANNSIKHFPIFGPLYRLQSLNLNNNELTTIGDDVLKGISHLRQLRLEGNAIKDISKTAFVSGKQNIELLDLSGNRLTAVPSQLISNSKNLKYLDLSENYFFTIASLDLRNLPELIELRLNKNMLTKVEPMGLKSIPKLKQLYLRSNLLTDIDDIDLVSQFEKLETLDLSNNAFKEVPNIKDHRSLRLLIMNDNKITAIRNTTFAFAKALQFINLEKNQITAIADYSFLTTDKLIVILLSSNNLKSLDAKSFTGAKGLRRISLCNNLLSEINSRTLDACPELEMLDLSHNRLSTIPNGLFKQVKKLNILNLSYNNVSSLEQETFAIKPDSIFLNGNPLRCDEKLKWFAKYLTQNKVNDSRNIADDVYCLQPDSSSALPLISFLLSLNTTVNNKSKTANNFTSDTSKLDVVDKKPMTDVLNEKVTNNKTRSNIFNGALERLKFLRMLLPPSYDIREIPIKVIQDVAAGKVPEFSKIPQELKFHLIKEFGKLLAEIFKEGKEMTRGLEQMQVEIPRKLPEKTNYEQQTINTEVVKSGAKPSSKDYFWYSVVSGLVVIICLSTVITGVITLAKLLREQSAIRNEHLPESFFTHRYSDSASVPCGSLLRFSTCTTSSSKLSGSTNPRNA